MPAINQLFIEVLCLRPGLSRDAPMSPLFERAQQVVADVSRSWWLSRPLPSHRRRGGRGGRCRGRLRGACRGQGSCQRRRSRRSRRLPWRSRRPPRLAKVAVRAAGGRGVTGDCDAAPNPSHSPRTVASVRTIAFWRRPPVRFALLRDRPLVGRSRRAVLGGRADGLAARTRSGSIGGGGNADRGSKSMHRVRHSDLSLA